MKTKTLLLLILILISVLSLQAQDVTTDLLGRINTLRLEQGLPPYTLHPALMAAANSHAQWMAETGEVTHTQTNGSTPASRANAAGYDSHWVSENIYMGGLASVDRAWEFWMNSSIHYAGITHANFTNIGIGTAQGEHGQAFVLVFGTLVWENTVSSSGNLGTGASDDTAEALAAPPAYVVGVDEYGNIMHEIQAGQTLGDVLLIYGYTWDDLPALLELNEFTDEDIRSLDIGAVILVPPQGGTYTPTPETTTGATEPADTLTQTTPEATESAAGIIEVTAQNNGMITEITVTAMDGIIPTPQPAQASGAESVVILISATPPELNPINSAIEPTTDTGLVLPATFVAPQVTATNIAPTATNTLAPTVTQPAMSVSTIAVATDILPTPIPTVPESQVEWFRRFPLCIFGAVAVQIGVLGLASLEFFRRMRRRKR
jgi:hypothetical protein